MKKSIIENKNFLRRKMDLNKRINKWLYYKKNGLFTPIESTMIETYRQILDDAVRPFNYIVNRECFRDEHMSETVLRYRIFNGEKTILLNQVVISNLLANFGKEFQVFEVFEEQLLRTIIRDIIIQGIDKLINEYTFANNLWEFKEIRNEN